MARILVLDDSRIARALIRQVLERSGHDVSEASSVAEALEAMKAAAFDVVTSDVLMPGGDGRTLLDAVVERGLTVPVVMVTADIQRTTREDCIRRGAFAVVDKPVKPDLLVKAVDEALVRRISPVNPVLTVEQAESLAELVNMGVGRAAAALNDLVGGHVELTVPSVSVLGLHEASRALGDLASGSVSSVEMGFQGSLEGCAFLVFPQQSALKLVALLTGEDPRDGDMDGVRSGTLMEVGNVLINSVVGTLSNVLSKPLRYSLPVYAEEPVMGLLHSHNEQPSPLLLAKTSFVVRQMQVEGSLLLLFELRSFDDLLTALDEGLRPR